MLIECVNEVLIQDERGELNVNEFDFFLSKYGEKDNLRLKTAMKVILSRCFDFNFSLMRRYVNEASENSEIVKQDYLE